MTEVSIIDIAKTIRSKNAGVDRITFDIIFQNREVYEHIRDNELLSAEDVLTLYQIESDRLAVFTFFDPAKAVKFTLLRNRPSGSPGEHDVMGAQQYPPLLDLTFEIPDGVSE